MHGNNVRNLNNNSSGCSTGVKYHIDCADRVSRDKTTQGFLSHLRYLQTIPVSKSAGMSDKKLLEGLLEKKHGVVVKITDDTTDTLRKEWDVYNTLKEKGLQGFLEYICYFECADRLENVRPDTRTSICDGEGSSMKVLMMDYVRNKSLGEYDWKATSLESFRSCCKQVVCIMLDAHEATGYRHSDLHSKNVLVKRSTCKSVRYACGATVAVRGFKAVIMDLEMSSFRQPVAKFFWDLEEFFGSLAYKVRIADATTVIPIKRMLMDFIENRNECAAAMQLLPLVDRIEFV